MRMVLTQRNLPLHQHHSPRHIMRCQIGPQASGCHAGTGWWRKTLAQAVREAFGIAHGTCVSGAAPQCARAVRLVDNRLFCRVRQRVPCLERGIDIRRCLFNCFDRRIDDFVDYGLQVAGQCIDRIVCSLNSFIQLCFRQAGLVIVVGSVNQGAQLARYVQFTDLALH